MNKTKTAVIGLGNMGRNHVRIYSEISQLVAVADISKEIGQIFSKKYKIPYFPSYEEMLSKIDIDAVSVVVPTKFHRQVGEYCLKAKCNVILEKPICDNVEDGEALIKTYKKSGKALMIGHIERFNPAIIKLKTLIDTGQLGEIISISATRVGIAPPAISGSDVTIDLAIHDIDIINYLLGEYPKTYKVFRKKLFLNNKFDYAILALEYSKALAEIQVNWITPVKIRKLVITGTKKYAIIDYIDQSLIIYDKVAELNRNGNFYEFISLSEQSGYNKVRIKKNEPLKSELDYFLKNLHNPTLFEDNVNSALNALKILN